MRLSKGYLQKQYKMNIKGEHTQVYLKAKKTTLPLLIIIKALECDLESQIH
jgi:hypothetical protein